MAEAATAPLAGGRHQRRFRNYLLDSHFQLKYSSYLVLIALVISVSLGAFLWRTSREVLAQSEKAVQQGEQVVARGREVVSESQKVSAVVQMNIIKDPVYSDNPGLLDAFKADAAKQDERLVQQQQALESQAAELKAQSASIARQQNTMLYGLCGALTMLVVVIGFAGIIVTHRVAGPIFKMKRQIKDVGEGHLRVPSPLRKGDELVDFFDAFRTMVINLRERQQGEIDKLESALKHLEGKASDEAMQPLHSLHVEMKDALDLK
jgi:nitrogen fixation/metabolism regulation signal transduction histidine kinase